MKALVLSYHFPVLKHIGVFWLALLEKNVCNEKENRIKQQQSKHSNLLRTLKAIVYHNHGCNLFKSLRSRFITLEYFEATTSTCIIYLMVKLEKPGALVSQRNSQN